jgi:hypothetical protein
VTTRRALALVFVFVLALAAAVGCAGASRVDGLDPATLPVALRGDYELFAQRCSRCHSLARPLNAHVTTVQHWRDYVDRMRRQPGSGIAPEDVPGIMRFLIHYSVPHGTATATPGANPR